MKKIRFIWVVLLLLCLSACAKEKVSEQGTYGTEENTVDWRGQEFQVQENVANNQTIWMDKFNLIDISDMVSSDESVFMSIYLGQFGEKVYYLYELHNKESQNIRYACVSVNLTDMTRSVHSEFTMSDIGYMAPYYLVFGACMPEEGILTINGREYAYEGFTFEQDADGNITSYTFNMKRALTAEEQARVDGRTASVGTSIDAMGIPYYMSQMNQFLRSFATEFNNILKKGVDLDGNSTSGYAFFTGTDTVTGEEFSFDGKDANGNAVNGSGSDTYYKLTAANICVNSMIVKDPTKLATTVDINGKGGVDAYDLVEELATLKSGKVLYRGGTADGFLKCMIADISVDTQQSEIFSKNYQNVASAIDTQRMSISGVDEDEEAMDLIKFQNAYNLSSKMVSVMAEIYDRLILETGV